MVVTFVDHQVTIASDGATTVVVTDPIPLNGNDRITCHVVVEYMFN